ncbi:SDR family oxidoreductase [bacterium]|nr:SDR family oxidoreductase [bacterium]
MGRNKEKLDLLCADFPEKKIIPVALDIGNVKMVREHIRVLKDQLPHIDVLINSAGTNSRNHFLEFEEEDYDKVMEVNVKGLYFLSQEIGKIMATQKFGKIINIASLNTFISLSKVSVYAASKGAVGQLTKAMAVDMARFNVQVNAVAPGFIKTPFNELLWGDESKSRWIKERTLCKRFGVPDDLVGTIQFLSSKASDFITGQTIIVDGGFLTGTDTLFG